MSPTRGGHDLPYCEPKRLLTADATARLKSTSRRLSCCTKALCHPECVSASQQQYLNHQQSSSSSRFFGGAMGELDAMQLWRGAISEYVFEHISPASMPNSEEIELNIISDEDEPGDTLPPLPVEFLRATSRARLTPPQLMCSKPKAITGLPTKAAQPAKPAPAPWRARRSRTPSRMPPRRRPSGRFQSGGIGRGCPCCRKPLVEILVELTRSDDGASMRVERLANRCEAIQRLTNGVVEGAALKPASEPTHGGAASSAGGGFHHEGRHVARVRPSARTRGTA